MSAQEFPDHVRRYLNVERALSDRAIDYFGLGWNAERSAISIPIENLVKYRSLTSYDPISGKTEHGPAKMFWGPKPAGEALPPFPAWRDWRSEDTEVIVEGEFDSLVCMAHGILAVSGTAGAATFLDEWASALTGQTRTLLYDNDQAGRAGAKKAAEKLLWAGCRTRIASWPADAPDGFDATDHFRLGGTAEDLRAILARATDYEPELDVTKYAKRRVVAA